MLNPILAVAGTITGIVLGLVLGIATGFLRIVIDLIWQLIKLIFKGLYTVIMFPFRKLLEFINIRNISQSSPEHKQQYQHQQNRVYDPDGIYKEFIKEGHNIDEIKVNKRIQEKADEAFRLSQEKREREVAERRQREQERADRKAIRKVAR